MTFATSERHLETVVIGGGQAGFAMSYYLAADGSDFVILDAGDRVGETWRNRWDSLRLFTPAFHSSLPGMPFPAPGGSFPSKDEVASYLERYAETYSLPVFLGRHVDALRAHDDGYLVIAGNERYVARNVVVATGGYHSPRIPDFASHLEPHVTQLHSRDYRNPVQIPLGDVLVVGAGNSGAEIAFELAASRRTYLAGRDTGHVPLRLIHNRLSLWLADRLVTTDTALGRKMRQEQGHRGDPLIRLTPRELAAAGVERLPRVTSVVEGKPQLEDGRVLEVNTVVWATGYRPDFDWITLPIFDEGGYPRHQRGVVDASPGLYFLGLPFQYSPTSTHIGGVGNDAHHIFTHLSAAATAASARRARTAGNSAVTVG